MATATSPQRPATPAPPPLATLHECIIALKRAREVSAESVSEVNRLHGKLPRTLPQNEADRVRVVAELDAVYRRAIRDAQLEREAALRTSRTLEYLAKRDGGSGRYSSLSPVRRADDEDDAGDDAGGTAADEDNRAHEPSESGYGVPAGAAAGGGDDGESEPSEAGFGGRAVGRVVDEEGWDEEEEDEEEENEEDEEDEEDEDDEEEEEEDEEEEDEEEGVEEGEGEVEGDAMEGRADLDSDGIISSGGGESEPSEAGFGGRAVGRVVDEEEEDEEEEDEEEENEEDEEDEEDEDDEEEEEEEEEEEDEEEGVGGG